MTSADLELNPGKPPILSVTGPIDAAEWVAEHRELLTETLLGHGAVLVRGLGVRDAALLGQLSAQLMESTVTDREAFARRQPLGGPVFSSLEWPADQPMCMHHEQSYLLEVPRLLAIGCFLAPVSGGCTGLADAEAVLAALPDSLVTRFAQTGWTLRRSFKEVVGLPWRDAFGAADREAAEKYCQDNQISFDWEPDGLLTRQTRRAVLDHPVTGRPVWFNQIAFLNEWTMDPAVREYLVMQLGADGLPFNTCYGDGEPITPETVRTINEVYESLTVREPWQAGDLLLVDNVRMAHSREPYQGRREIGLVQGDPAPTPRG
ncbi:TauD/TfdA family dioxygenase [Nonomuraea sp. 10N515B]|uniref:TauD/TfdA family dioxygenase n=1 Tax=Nonomuraea sp. 10N515B TaxID=3457422 RepID=UPI003FCEBE65